MRNAFKHLDDNVTAIECRDSKSKEMVTVNMDTDAFEYISKKYPDAVWRRWISGGTDNIGSTDSDRKALFLKRELSKYYFGEEFTEKHYIKLIIEDTNQYGVDFRKCNFYPYPKNAHVKLSDEELKQLMSKIPAIKEKNTVTTANSNDVQCIEYDGKLLIIENGQVAETLSLNYVDAIIHKYSVAR